MKTTTNLLTGKALDYAVFTALGMSYWLYKDAKFDNNAGYTDWVLNDKGQLVKYRFDEMASRAGHWYQNEIWTPSTDPSQGHQLIDEHQISLRYVKDKRKDGGFDTKVMAELWVPFKFQNYEGRGTPFYSDGPTALVAACRCFVASQLGYDIDIPEELLK